MTRGERKGGLRWFSLHRPVPPPEVTASTLDQDIAAAGASLDAARRAEAMQPLIGKIAAVTRDSELRLAGLAFQLEEARVGDKPVQRRRWRRSSPPESYLIKDKRLESEVDPKGVPFRMQYHIEMVNGQRVAVPDMFRYASYEVRLAHGLIDTIHDIHFRPNPDSAKTSEFLGSFATREENPVYTIIWKNLQTDPSLDLRVQTGRDADEDREDTRCLDFYSYSINSSGEALKPTIETTPPGWGVSSRSKRPDPPPLTTDLFVDLLQERLDQVPAA